MNKLTKILVAAASAGGYTITREKETSHLTHTEDGWVLEGSSGVKNVTLLPAGTIDWDEIIERGLS